MLSFINRHLDHLINTVTDCVLVVVGVAMVMSVRMAPALPLIILFLIHSECLMLQQHFALYSLKVAFRGVSVRVFSKQV